MPQSLRMYAFIMAIDPFVSKPQLCHSWKASFIQDLSVTGETALYLVSLIFLFVSLQPLLKIAPQHMYFTFTERVCVISRIHDFKL